MKYQHLGGNILPKGGRNINTNKIGTCKQIYISWIRLLKFLFVFSPLQAGFVVFFKIMIHKCITLNKLLTSLNLSFHINKPEMIISQPSRTMMIR